jgi:hypothetical protein
MYCPQCGTESPATLQYCRICGANLKMIGKAVSLSEAIARSDRGPLPKLKEMVKNFKIEQVTEEVSGALDKLNEEIVRSAAEGHKEKVRRRREHRRHNEEERPFWIREKKTPERRREEHRTKGIVSFFSGVGLTIFLYGLANSLVLKLPPDVIAKIPFEVQPLLHVLWTVGLIPTLSGAGHFAASFFVKSTPVRSVGPAPEEFETASASPISGNVPPQMQAGATAPVTPPSVTEQTTNLLTTEAARK